MAEIRKVALVTGGGRGIGFGIAGALADEGWNIAFNGMRDAGEVGKAVATLEHKGVDVLYCQADVSDTSARAHLLDAVRDRFGCLNVLVNNAGIAPPVRADVLEATEESYEFVMRANLQGPYFLTQAVARWMIDQKKSDAAFAGCIINVSSISATVVSVNRGEYCISKAGMSMTTQLWAVRLGEFNIPVYEIQPGLIKTDMSAGAREKYDKLIEEGLLVQARWGLPADVGKAAAMLARGDLPYSNGHVVMVDGGLTIPRL